MPKTARIPHGHETYHFQFVSASSSTHLRADRIGAGPHKRFDLQCLLQRLEQLNYILPINNALLKLRSTTTSIPCVHTVSQWSECTTFKTRSTMSCGGPMAGPWRCRPG